MKHIIYVGRIPIELVAPDVVKPIFRTPCAVHTLWWEIYESSLIRFGIGGVYVSQVYFVFLQYKLRCYLVS